MSIIICSKKQEELDKMNKNSIKFTNMNSIYGEHMKRLCRKGFYTYEYVDNDSKLDQIGSPPKEAFYSHLSQTSITEEEYKHCQHVYEKLKCNTFYDYHLAD